MTENKQDIALCVKCQKLLIDTEIIRWLNSGTWLPWCFPCFKREHLQNLTRLQEGN